MVKKADHCAAPSPAGRYLGYFVPNAGRSGRRVTFAGNVGGSIPAPAEHFEKDFEKYPEEVTTTPNNKKRKSPKKRSKKGEEAEAKPGKKAKWRTKNIFQGP